MPWLRRSSSRSSASSPTFRRARCRARAHEAYAANAGDRNPARSAKVFDVRENVKAGVRHLRYLMDRYQGNLSLALAAYNAAVARYRGVPPYAGTRAHVARILSLLQ